MTVLRLLLVALACAWHGVVTANQSVDQMRQLLGTTTRQLMMQQFFNEERVRSEGSSGIKQIRSQLTGTKDYHSATHVGRSVFAVHDHSNNVRTVGMGEFAAVLNGVEFRTRHNDYRLYQAHSTKKDYHAVEEIPFPAVPPEVIKQPTLIAQIKEMREWFKAWRDQNATVRDYTKYFQPVLCYLEGAWTTTARKIDEPFHSDRHFLDAKNWLELQEKVRFTSYTGSKSRLENLAFLPTTVVGLNGTIPHFAQWNYRILCHKLKKDLPTNRFQAIDDLTYRMTHGMTMDKLRRTRAARFRLNSLDRDAWNARPTRRELLDDLMEQIPGKDNYAGRLRDEGLDSTVLNVGDGKEKDVSRYHRIFKVANKDAMGQQMISRGFSDPNMFAAMTTQNKVAGLDLKKCPRKKKCHVINQKWTYAIPLEIVYLTPLHRWNPHKLQYKGDARSTAGKTVTAGGRYGACTTPAKAYKGVNSKTYYLTPDAFYSGKEVKVDAADTSRGTKCVLDPSGRVKRTRASGTRIFFPYIPGVGVLRQRYPIAPIHGQGGTVWKELNALKDIVLNPDKFKHMFGDSASVGVAGKDIELQTGKSMSGATTEHRHTVSLTTDEIAQIKGGVEFEAITSHENGHEHALKIRWNSKSQRFYFRRCDGAKACWDGHGKILKVTAS